MTIDEALSEWASYNMTGRLSDPLSRYRSKVVCGSYSDFRGLIALHVERFSQRAHRLDSEFVWRHIAGLSPNWRVRPWLSPRACLAILGHEKLALCSPNLIPNLIVADFAGEYERYVIGRGTWKAHPLPEHQVHAVTIETEFVPTEEAVNAGIEEAQLRGDIETEKRLKAFYGQREQGYTPRRKKTAKR